MKAAEFEEDPDELMSNIKKDMKNPVTTVYVSPEGKKRFVVREGGTAGSSTPNSAAMKYAAATAAQQSSRANLSETERVWQEMKDTGSLDKSEMLKLDKELQKRQAEFREADATLRSMRSQFPELGQQTKETPQTPAAVTPSVSTPTPAAAPVRMKYVDGKLVPVQ